MKEQYIMAFICMLLLAILLNLTTIYLLTRRCPEPKPKKRRFLAMTLTTLSIMTCGALYLLGISKKHQKDATAPAPAIEKTKQEQTTPKNTYTKLENLTKTNVKLP